MWRFRSYSTPASIVAEAGGCYNPGVKISDLGEFGLIGLVAERVKRSQAASPNLLLGIGDDASVWRSDHGLELATTDTLVQDVHFRLDTLAWRDLGWKALAVNLSDIAAMGGVPAYALVTLGLPGDTTATDVEAFYDGMLELAEKHSVVIAGGDMVAAPVAMITVALTGHAPSPRPGQTGYMRRSAAQVGDIIAVTGHLGSSAAGLRLLLGQGKTSAEARGILISAHLRPQPRVAEGQLLLQSGVQTAIDISDGLIADLGHICEASGVAARIDANRLPVHPALRETFGDEALALALTGGEDYELLFTATAEIMAQVQGKLEIPVSVIGDIVAGPVGKVMVLDSGGQPITWEKAGWDHFRGG